jgi:hypothetical protein
MSRSIIHNAMHRLAKAESAFMGSEFLAPVLRGRGVSAKIAGVRCDLTVDPADFQGWGVFRAISHREAQLARNATGTQRRGYLRLFPAVELVICQTGRAEFKAAPANPSDGRFYFVETVEVRLASRIDLFDIVIARFDSRHFWYDQLHPRADPAAAAYLRRELTRMTDPRLLKRAGLGKGQRLVYAHHFTHRASLILGRARRSPDARLTEALAHAGALLCDFADTGDSFRVCYSVDGRRHTSVVQKQDLTVHSAGICLSGQDRSFDLNSLVGVMREGEAIGRIARF